jgi:hypothetical protein
MPSPVKRNASFSLRVGESLVVARMVEQVAPEDLIRPDRLEREARPKAVLAPDLAREWLRVEVTNPSELSDVVDPQRNVVE